MRPDNMPRPFGAAVPAPAQAEPQSIRLDDLAKLRHMLGATIDVASRDRGYRNRYIANLGGPQEAGMERLVAAGFAMRGADLGGTRVYRATRNGCEVAGLTRAQIRRAMDD